MFHLVLQKTKRNLTLALRFMWLWFLWGSFASFWCRSSSLSASTVSVCLFLRRYEIKKNGNSLCLTAVRDEQRRQNFTLTMQNQKLLAEKEALTRRTEDLSRERDQLNWTMEAILQYDNFPVNKHCPHRGQQVHLTVVWVF